MPNVLPLPVWHLPQPHRHDTTDIHKVPAPFLYTKPQCCPHTRFRHISIRLLSHPDRKSCLYSAGNTSLTLGSFAVQADGSLCNTIFLGAGNYVVIAKVGTCEQTMEDTVKPKINVSCPERTTELKPG